MTRLSDWIQWRTETAAPAPVGGLTLHLQSRALLVRWPGGGGVWNRPVAVLVERDGRVDRLPIRDMTRQVQLWLLGGSMLLSVWTLGAMARRGGNKRSGSNG